MESVPSLYDPLTKLAHVIVLLIGRVISERIRRNKGYVCEFTCVIHINVSRDSYHIKQVPNMFQTCVKRVSNRLHVLFQCPIRCLDSSVVLFNLVTPVHFT